MASVKIVLRKKKNKDGTFPLALRITQNRRSTYVYLSEHIKESEWDADYHKVKTVHPNSKRLNNKLLKRLTEVQRDILNLELQVDDPSLQRIKAELQKDKKRNTFFGHVYIGAKAYDGNLSSGGVGLQHLLTNHKEVFSELLDLYKRANPDIPVAQN